MSKAERFVQSMTESIRGKVNLMIARARVLLSNDEGAIQSMQVNLLADEVQDDIERIQNYGMTSHPHPGAEAVMAAVGGNRDHGVLIAVDDRRYRMTGLDTGEVAIYDDQKQSVHLTRGGIVIKGAGKPMLLTDTAKITLDADVDVTGKLKVDKDIDGQQNITAQQEISDQAGEHRMSGMRMIYNEHTHPETDSTTRPPNEQM